jgi:hypothetical protein
MPPALRPQVVSHPPPALLFWGHTTPHHAAPCAPTPHAPHSQHDPAPRPAGGELSTANGEEGDEAEGGEGEEQAAPQGSGHAWRKLMNLVLQLRKVVNHPFMFPESEPHGEGQSMLEELLDASGELLADRVGALLGFVRASCLPIPPPPGPPSCPPAAS